jgi:hypothetical protein
MTVTNGFSQYLENACLNWLRGTTFPAAPATLYLALFTTPPVNGVDSAAVEVSGNNYSRLAVTSTDFAAPTGSAPASTHNTPSEVMATPSGAWGAVTGWGLYDASSGGNLLAYGTFASVSPTTGDTVEFLTGALVVTVS